jgi:AcrR family transcriptional regulator
VPPPAIKPMRADARRNRDRLLQVADEVFATQGVGASTEDIARAAGVGIGTLFRHFPTKEALLEAVFVTRLHRLAADANRLSNGGDPGATFESFFRMLVAEAHTRLTIVEALALRGIDISVAAADAKRDFSAALERLLRRAQQAGAVRLDIGIAELLALIVGASRAVQHAGDDQRVESHLVNVILDGLAPDRSPAARPSPTPTRRSHRLK